MTKQMKQHELNRIRTLIAFAYGDTRHGGPSHAKELEDLKRELHEVEAMETEE